MKVLIVSHRVPFPLKDGGAIALHNTLKGLKSEGHEISLFALAAKKHNIDLKKASSSLEGICTCTFYPIDTDVKIGAAFLNLFSNKSYNVSRFYDAEFERLLADKVRSESFDIIQFETVFAATYAPRLRHLAPGSSFILRQHNVEAEIWKRRSAETKNPLKKMYLGMLADRLERYESECLKWFDGVIALTDSDKSAFLEAESSATVEVIPPGFEFGPAHEPQNVAPTFFHIGSMKWEPNKDGVQWFIHSIWPKAKKVCSSAAFHFAGLGLSKKWENHPDQGVFNHGEVDSLKTFLEDKSVCVVPLRSGSGIRIKILECMAAGKLVFSTQIGIQGIPIVPGKHHQEFENQNDFEKLVSWMEKHPEEAAAMALEGQKFIRTHYSLENEARRTTQFYHWTQGRLA